MKATTVIATLFLAVLAGCGNNGGAQPLAQPAQANNVFTVHVPSLAAPDRGIVVRVFYPDAAGARYPEGAPVAVFVAGGHGAGSLPADSGSSNPLSECGKNGYILIYFFLPGGSSGNASSGGSYDYRGPSCKRAVADVIRYALGKISDTEGKLLTDRVAHALTSNVGVIGSSNGGNLAITTFADHGSEFPELAWFAGWESPIGDQNIVVELSTGSGLLNPYYLPGTCTVTACPWPGLSDALAFDALVPFQLQDPFTSMKQSVQGALFIDGNGNGRIDAGEFQFFPLGGPGPVVDGTHHPKGYISSELAAAVDSQSTRLFPSGRPSWLATTAEVTAYWADRDGSMAFSQAHAALPNLLVMDIASMVDHVQKQPDHPHVRSFISGWLDAGHSFVRLNPDAEYMALTTGKDRSNFPDNAANTPIPYPGIEATLEPETVSGILVSQAQTDAAVIFELADRARLNDRSANLNSVLYQK